MFGIQKVVCLTSMDTEFPMMLTDPLNLGSPRLLERENGSGLELDLISWCKYKVDYLKLALGRRIFRFGKVSICMPRHGSYFKLNCRR
jgi:hypothetical protein